MSSDKVIHLSNDSFENEIMDTPLPCLVDFWAPWCGPCRMIGPIIDELAEEYDGEVKICKINIDEEQELAVRFKVMTIPTILLFKNGDIAEKNIGASTKDTFVNLISKHL